MKPTYYNLIQTDGQQEIGTIKVVNNSDLKPLIEKACKGHFAGECCIEQSEIDSNITYLSKQPQVHLKVKLIDDDCIAQIAISNTWVIEMDEPKKYFCFGAEAVTIYYDGNHDVDDIIKQTDDYCLYVYDPNVDNAVSHLMSAFEGYGGYIEICEAEYQALDKHQNKNNG